MASFLQEFERRGLDPGADDGDQFADPFVASAHLGITSAPVSAPSGNGRSPVVFCASVTYPVDAGRFDLEYFATRHAPMFAELLGTNCIRWEAHRPVAAPGAPPPPFLAAAYFWVSSGEDFGRVLSEQGPAIYADIENFSDAQPSRGWSEVL